MKDFRGKLIPVSDEDYILEDDESDTNSEIAAAIEEDFPIEGGDNDLNEFANLVVGNLRNQILTGLLLEEDEEDLDDDADVDLSSDGDLTEEDEDEGGEGRVDYVDLGEPEGEPFLGAIEAPRFRITSYTQELSIRIPPIPPEQLEALLEGRSITVTPNPNPGRDNNTAAVPPSPSVRPLSVINITADNDPDAAIAPTSISALGFHLIDGTARLILPMPTPGHSSSSSAQSNVNEGGAGASTVPLPPNPNVLDACMCMKNPNANILLNRPDAATVSTALVGNAPLASIMEEPCSNVESESEAMVDETDNERSSNKKRKREDDEHEDLTSIPVAGEFPDSKRLAETNLFPEAAVAVTVTTSTSTSSALGNDKTPERSAENDCLRLLSQERTPTNLRSNAATPESESCRSGESEGRVNEREGEEDCDLDVTCNPMVSDFEEDETENDTLRGDRIGSTTYSERHVLKILMNWVQELPKYSHPLPEPTPTAQEESTDSMEANMTSKSNQSEESGTVDKYLYLEPDFEEGMALLWDMSFEPDIMNFLVQHNIFNIIGETINISTCDRLKEIALGIIANIISQQSIIEDFSIHDASLKLVESIITTGIKMPRVPVLIQVFAVLRRITWFIRNVAVIRRWMDLFISQDFLNCATFILSSSTNVLLLGNVIVTVFSILEGLNSDSDAEKDKTGEEGSSRGDGTGGGGGDADEDESEAPRATYFGSALTVKERNLESFCQTSLIPSLCEALNELMRNPEPKKSQMMDDKSTQHRDEGTKNLSTLEELELETPIPEGHVQLAIMNGLSALAYLYKTPSGKSALREHYSMVLNLMLKLLSKFTQYSGSTDHQSRLDYFALAVNLLSFCHKEENELNVVALEVPLLAAAELMKEGDEEESVVENPADSNNAYIALVAHEYFASLNDHYPSVLNEWKTKLLSTPTSKIRSHHHRVRTNSSSDNDTELKILNLQKIVKTIDSLVASVMNTEASSPTPNP